MNKKIISVLAVVIIVVVGYLIYKNLASRTVAKDVVYINTGYGLKISLPASWAGYKIGKGIREIRDVSTGAVVASSSTITIRHPLWTKEIPRQDIPVDIYTLSEWEKIKSGSYSVSAAPIPPSELARNTQYVFALPARYNFVYPVGFEEVDQIIQNKSVIATEIEFVYKNANADLIQVKLPNPDAVVKKEFSVVGKARGTWFFEASFPVVLLDKDGQVLSQGAAKAQGNWMTTEFVPFKIDMKIANNYTGKATLVLKKDNPSGDSERDASVSYGVNIKY